MDYYTGRRTSIDANERSTRLGRLLGRRRSLLRRSKSLHRFIGWPYDPLGIIGRWGQNNKPAVR